MKKVSVFVLLFSLTLVSNAQATRVFGHSQQDVLRLDGDPNGSACSSAHTRDDFSNRWCHALFVKLMDQRLRSSGVPKALSALASASLFLPKEFLVDKNPSLADLAIAEYELHEFDRGSAKLALSLFGDGATVISFEKNF